jgi:cob(I)alamin adenosyltransferase
MKIYTGTGDRGMTSLFSGERVEKDHRQVEAYGDLDELNSALGVLAATLPDTAEESVTGTIRTLQSTLLAAGSLLASSPDSPATNRLEKIGTRVIEELEQSIDDLDRDLPRLAGFLLPGGHPSAAWSHLARTICRRAERHAVRQIRASGRLDDEAYRHLIVFLNRLSDYLFVLARHLNRVNGVEDIPWKP